MLSFLHALTKRLWLREIPDERGVYLERYWLDGWMPSKILTPAETREEREEKVRPQGFQEVYGIYLHRFLKPDEDAALHSHPWKWGLSIILVGGYTEECIRSGRIITRRLRPGRMNFFGTESFHRITELHGQETWSLFIAGPKAASWGFWVPERGFVSWRQRLKERGTEVKT